MGHRTGRKHTQRKRKLHRRESAQIDKWLASTRRFMKHAHAAGFGKKKAEPTSLTVEKPQIYYGLDMGRPGGDVTILSRGKVDETGKITWLSSVKL